MCVRHGRVMYWLPFVFVACSVLESTDIPMMNAGDTEETIQEEFGNVLEDYQVCTVEHSHHNLLYNEFLDITKQ